MTNTLKKAIHKFPHCQRVYQAHQVVVLLNLLGTHWLGYKECFNLRHEIEGLEAQEYTWSHSDMGKWFLQSLVPSIFIWKSNVGSFAKICMCEENSN